MEDGRLALRVERLEQAVEAIRPLLPTNGAPGGVQAGFDALLTALLSQESMADLLIRAALEGGVSGTVERRVVRESVTVNAGASTTLTWAPQPARVLRVYGALNVIALPHEPEVTVTLMADQDPQPIAAAIPMALDWSLESYLIPTIRTALRLEVQNASDSAVTVVVDTTLVDLEPVFHDDVLAPALARQFARLRELVRGE